MTSNAEQIMQSLELCAERSGDITPLVYQRFFELCPDAYELMGHSDEHMQGRMLEQVIELFFSDEHFGEGGYLDWELDNHLVGYRVPGQMYAHFFAAILAVVQESLGDAWSPEVVQAWDEKVAAIMQHVNVHPAVVGQL